MVCGLLPLVLKANEFSERVVVSLFRACADMYCRHSRLRPASRIAIFHFHTFWPQFISIISLISVIIVFLSSHCVPVGIAGLLRLLNPSVKHTCIPTSHMIIDGTSTLTLWFRIPKMFYAAWICVYSNSHVRGQTDSSGAVFERMKIAVFRSGPTFEASCSSHLAFPTTVVMTAEWVQGRDTWLVLKENGSVDSFATLLSRCIPTTSKVGFVEIFALDKSASIFY